MISEKSNLAKVLNFMYAKMQRRWDYFVVITGDEGTGKSRGVFLNIMDYWYKKKLGKKPPKDCFVVDLKSFPKILKSGKPFDFRGLDEAGDALDTKDRLQKLNKALYQTYTIIREKGFLSVVCLPSFFDLDPSFRKRRVRLLINCYKRVDNKCKSCNKDFTGDVCPFCGSIEYIKGYVCFEIFNRKRIHEIIERNKYRMIKKVRVGVNPVCRGIVHEYKGELVDYYTGLKTEKSNQALVRLDEIVEDESDGKLTCKHVWRFVKTEHLWYCRNCGMESFENPYKTGTGAQ